MGSARPQPTLGPSSATRLCVRETGSRDTSAKAMHNGFRTRCPNPAHSDLAGRTEVHVRERYYICRRQSLAGTGEVDPLLTLILSDMSVPCAVSSLLAAQAAARRASL